MNNRYKLKITGKSPKRFVKDLITLKISLYSVKIGDDYTIIIVDDDGLGQIKKIKTSYKIEIIKEYGLIKYINSFKKYFWLITSVVIGIIVIEVLSNIVFDIEVEHSKSEIRQIILNDLDEYGIKKYRFRVSYKEKENIKKKILAKETERIEWLEIERQGTKYVVKVEERIKNKKKENLKSQNIVASKDAMILSINATKGEVVKKKYDYVKKGEVLISGFIKRDDKVVSKTKADGEVFGEVWYKVDVDLPKKYHIINKTGKSKKKIELQFLNNSIFLFDFSDKYKTYSLKRNSLIRSTLLPIGINYTTIYETEEINKKYSYSNASKDALEIANNKLKNKIGKNGSVISKKVLKKTEKNSRIIVEVFFKVKEDIRDIEDIENIKIEDIEGDKDESSN